MISLQQSRAGSLNLLRSPGTAMHYPVFLSVQNNIEENIMNLYSQPVLLLENFSDTVAFQLF